MGWSIVTCTVYFRKCFFSSTHFFNSINWRAASAVASSMCLRAWWNWHWFCWEITLNSRFPFTIHRHLESLKIHGELICATINQHKADGDGRARLEMYIHVMSTRTTHPATPFIPSKPFLRACSHRATAKTWREVNAQFCCCFSIGHMNGTI